MLSYDQAVFFLEGILRMPQNWRELVQEKPLEFLTLYLKRHATRVPFQNMHMASVEEGHRWFPSEHEIVHTGLSNRGGCCIHLSYFTKLVLQAIGFDAFVVRGDHYGAPVVGTHCIAMVRLHGPKETGIYMVEAGGAYPMLEPIPMDKHKLPYRTLQAGGFPYELRDIGKGWIGKFHIGGGVLGGEFTDKKEILRTCWDLKPRALWEFDYPMLETFTKPCYSALLRHPYLYRCFNNTEFCRLFPELPENATKNGRGKVLATKPKPQSISKIGNVVATKKSKPEESKIVGLVSASNGKLSTSVVAAATINEKQSSSITNGKSTVIAATTPSSNGKAVPLAAGNKTSANNVKTSNAKNGKDELELTLSKLETAESDEDEFEVVTEEEVETDEDDDLDDPKNFIFAFKRRIVVADAKSRKLVKNYDSYAEMAADLKKYFPRIPSKVVDKAIKTFTVYESTPSPYDGVLY